MRSLPAEGSALAGSERLWPITPSETRPVKQESYMPELVYKFGQHTCSGASPPRSKKGNEFQGKRSDSTEMKSLDFEVEIHFPTTLRKATHYFEKLRAGKLVADQPKIKK